RRKLRCADERNGMTKSQTTIASGGTATARLRKRLVSILFVRGHEALEIRAQRKHEPVPCERIWWNVLEEEGARLVRHVRQHVLAVDAGITAVPLDDDARLNLRRRDEFDVLSRGDAVRGFFARTLGL